MSVQIAVFYHGLLFTEADVGKPLESALTVFSEQMQALQDSGLASRANHLRVCLNGGNESFSLAKEHSPAGATLVLHGLQSKSENLTLAELENWLPGHSDWYVFYFHSKGATWPTQSDHGKFCAMWRRCMMGHCVHNWQRCAADLGAGAESVGCHWMTGMADGTQNIWAGNFWWAKASFLLTLPSIYDRARIKLSGIGAVESRYESEVWIGNGKRLPVVKDYCQREDCIKGLMKRRY